MNKPNAANHEIVTRPIMIGHTYIGIFIRPLNTSVQHAKKRTRRKAPTRSETSLSQAEGRYRCRKQKGDMAGNQTQDPPSYFYEIVKVGSNWFRWTPLVTIYYINQSQSKFFTFKI